MGMWRGTIGDKKELEEAELMIKALKKKGGAQDIIDKIKHNFRMH